MLLMIDVDIYRAVREQDFLQIPALELRKYEWASLQVYNELVYSRMERYHTKYDLLSWLKFWTDSWRLVSPFQGEVGYENLKETSRQRHDKLLKYVFSTYKETTSVHDGYDIWNAIDSHVIIENCGTFENILDFGAGYGRLGLIFGEHERVKNYLSVESIELSYLLQNITFSALYPEKFYEYVEYAFERKSFDVDLNRHPGIHHLPMWKWNLVPAHSIDVIMAVFVLPEVNEFALKEFMSQSVRCLKFGGYLYIRDHLYQTGDKNHKGAHLLNTEEILTENHFHKIYEGCA
jgi:hypothetical protein